MRTVAMCALLAMLCTPAAGQWLNHPTPGVPKGPDGKPNLTAPTPRAADGKPDLSGLWRTRTIEIPGVEPLTEPVAGSLNFPPEFGNLGAVVKGGLPHQPWALALWQARQYNLRVDSPAGRCKPVGILQRHTNLLHGNSSRHPACSRSSTKKTTSSARSFTDGRALCRSAAGIQWLLLRKWVGDTLVVTTVGFATSGGPTVAAIR